MDVTSWIDRFVTRLREEQAIRSAAVETAFRRVPRHRLLETFYVFKHGSPQLGWEQVPHNPQNPLPQHLDLIYSDQALVTLIKDSVPLSSTSQPSLMAQMLERLELSSGMKVLEIGTGTGYNAALMAELVGNQELIVSVDIQREVIDQTARLLAEAGYADIKLLERDGFYGVPEEAPFDRIVATAGCPDLSPHWVAQLKPGGFMLVPLTHGFWSPVLKIWQGDDGLGGKVIALSSFLSMEGQLGTDGLRRQPQQLIAPRENTQQLPLLNELGADRPGEKGWGFYYFLAMRTHSALSDMKPTGSDLPDGERGMAPAAPEKADLPPSGDHGLSERIHELFTEWRKLGEPAPPDFDIRFQPLAEEPPESKSPPWTIERRYYRQIITLGSKN